MGTLISDMRFDTQQFPLIRASSFLVVPSGSKQVTLLCQKSSLARGHDAYVVHLIT